MAIVSCNPIAIGRGGSVNEKGVREYDDVYLVQSDILGEPLFNVANAPGLPPLYISYPSDPGALLLGRRPEVASEGGGYLWNVTCHYSSEYDPNDQEPDPLQRPVRWRIDGDDYTKPFVEDADGKPVLNLAGDKYEDVPDIEAGRKIYVAVRNEESFASIDANQEAFENTVNLDEWNGKATGTVWLKKIRSSELKVENGVAYYEVTYEFHYDPQGWQVSLLEWGYRCTPTWTNGIPNKVKAAGGVPKLLIPRPNVAGACIFTDDPSKAYYTNWYAREFSDFDGLGLDFPDDDTLGD